MHSLLHPVPGEDSRQSEFLGSVFPAMGHARNEQKFPVVGLGIDPETVHERGRFADMSRRGSRDGTGIVIVIRTHGEAYCDELRIWRIMRKKPFFEACARLLRMMTCYAGLRLASGLAAKLSSRSMCGIAYLPATKRRRHKTKRKRTCFDSKTITMT